MKITELFEHHPAISVNALIQFQKELNNQKIGLDTDMTEIDDLAFLALSGALQKDINNISQLDKPFTIYEMIKQHTEFKEFKIAHSVNYVNEVERQKALDKAFEKDISKLFPADQEQRIAALNDFKKEFGNQNPSALIIKKYSKTQSIKYLSLNEAKKHILTLLNRYYENAGWGFSLSLLYKQNKLVNEYINKIEKATNLRELRNFILELDAKNHRLEDDAKPFGRYSIVGANHYFLMFYSIGMEALQNIGKLGKSTDSYYLKHVSGYEGESIFEYKNKELRDVLRTIFSELNKDSLIGKSIAYESLSNQKTAFLLGLNKSNSYVSSLSILRNSTIFDKQALGHIFDYLDIVSTNTHDPI